MRTLIVFLLLLFSLTAVTAQSEKDIVSTREMDRINWMEFRDSVPSKVKTVLLPTGTLEPHGVINNGADARTR
jgi:creatinine amidohydrolase